jgi:hypothetical protein
MSTADRRIIAEGAGRRIITSTTSPEGSAWSGTSTFPPGNIVALERFAVECTADRLWSAGAVLPLSVGEAMLRPQAARSMAARRKGASMACALQKFVSQYIQLEFALRCSALCIVFSSATTLRHEAFLYSGFHLSVLVYAGNASLIPAYLLSLFIQVYPLTPSLSPNPPSFCRGIGPCALVSLAFWRVLEKKRGGAEAQVRIWPLGGYVLDEDCECTGLGCRR